MSSLFLDFCTLEPSSLISNSSIAAEPSHPSLALLFDKMSLTRACTVACCLQLVGSRKTFYLHARTERVQRSDGVNKDTDEIESGAYDKVNCPTHCSGKVDTAVLVELLHRLFLFSKCDKDKLDVFVVDMNERKRVLSCQSNRCRRVGSRWRGH